MESLCKIMKGEKMTLNYSLQLTEQIKELMRNDLSGVLKPYFPEEKIIKFNKNPKKRDRIYNDETTLMTMIVTAVQEDRSIQNAVNLYAEVHNRNISRIERRIEEANETERKKDRLIEKMRGRPKTYKPRTIKSKLKEISTNTGSYTTAKQRLDIDLVKMVYEESADFSNMRTNNKWKDMEVVITDGTYIQMQDSAELRELYEIKSESETYKSGYPQGLLQVLIKQGSGAIKQFELGNRHVSELELKTRMLPKISKGTLILADDLYNSFAIFSLIKKKWIGNHSPWEKSTKLQSNSKVKSGR